MAKKNVGGQILQAKITSFISYFTSEERDIAAAPERRRPPDQGLLTVLLDLEATHFNKKNEFPIIQ